MSAGRRRLMTKTRGPGISALCTYCSVRQPLSYETEVGRGEPTKVGKDRRKVPCVHSKPGSQRGKVLIAGGGGDPTASAVAHTGVVRTAESEGGEFAVSLFAVNRTAHDHVMVPPAMVAALAVSLKSPAEVAASEGGYAFGKIGIAVERSNLIHGCLEGIHTLADLGKQVRVRAIKNGTTGRRIGLAAVQVIATHLAKKDLALHAEAVTGTGGPMTGFDETGDHLELWA